MTHPMPKLKSINIISLGLTCAAFLLASSVPAGAAAQPAVSGISADSGSPAAAPGSALREDAPDRYTVVRGDTLWAISGRFLKDPWRWGDLWNMNKDQIRNPHLIYPGDVVVINRNARPGEAMAQLIQAGRRQQQQQQQPLRLAPDIRIETLTPHAIPAIPPQKIEPFLVRPFIVSDQQIASAATIVETQENRVVIGAGNVAYVRGIDEKLGRNFQLFRPGEMLVDPDTKQPLGREAFYLGEAKVVRFGEISTVEIVRSTQEIELGDRLLPTPPSGFPEYVPRPPAQPISGKIIGVYGRANVIEVAQYDIVTLNRGTKEGLEVGHVLAMYRNPLAERSANRPATVFGRTGPTGSDVPWAIQDIPRETLSLNNLRGQPLWGKVGPTGSDLPRGAAPVAAPVNPSAAGLPEERYGVLMVFRTFDRVSYGIIMDTSRPVNVNDMVRNP